MISNNGPTFQGVKFRVCSKIWYILEDIYIYGVTYFHKWYDLNEGLQSWCWCRWLTLHWDVMHGILNILWFLIWRPLWCDNHILILILNILSMPNAVGWTVSHHAMYPLIVLGAMEVSLMGSRVQGSSQVVCHPGMIYAPSGCLSRPFAEGNILVQVESPNEYRTA